MNNKFFHSVYLNEDLCRGCINCIKRCPTKAIRVQNGKAFIIKEFCIDCGECIRHCPHHAKQARRDHIDILENYEYTVALPAPSLYSQFNNLSDVNIVLTALLAVGFDDVFEVSAAAELVSEESRRYVNAHPKQWPYISTACPTVERLIRVRFPNLIDHLLPLLPPAEVAAKLARRRAMDKTGLPAKKIGVIFLSPCPSKVAFVKSPLGIAESRIDGVMAIKDVYKLLLPHMKEAERAARNLSISGKIGVGWGNAGGEAAGMITEEYLAADGIENVIRVLEDMEDEKFSSELQFIELNACSGGCVGGVLNVENPYLAKSKLKHLKKYMPVSVQHQSDYPVFCQNDLYFSEEITYEPVYRLGKSLIESMVNLSTVEELMREFPGLDCGSCGAPTCRALAEDIVRGHAREEDCIYLLRSYYDTLKKSQLIKEKETDKKESH